MSELLQQIKRALPPTINPEFSEDLISDIALLVLEGRIEVEKLREGIRFHLKRLKRQYANFDLSFDQPIGDDESTATLKDVDLKVASSPRRCPTLYCRNPVNPGRLYCSRGCGWRHYQQRNRNIDPKQFEKLHSEEWLSRDQLAKIFGVTRHAIDNVVKRHGLSRNLPRVCRIKGCKAKAVRIRHCKGWLAGNLCDEHKRAAQRRYVRESRARRIVPSTPEQRRENARRASMARWSNPKWSDPQTRSEFSARIFSGRRRLPANGAVTAQSTSPEATPNAGEDTGKVKGGRG